LADFEGLKPNSFPVKTSHRPLPDLITFVTMRPP